MCGLFLFFCVLTTGDSSTHTHINLYAWVMQAAETQFKLWLLSQPLCKMTTHLSAVLLSPKCHRSCWRQTCCHFASSHFASRLMSTPSSALTDAILRRAKIQRVIQIDVKERHLKERENAFNEKINKKGTRWTCWTTGCVTVRPGELCSEELGVPLRWLEEGGRLLK